MLSPLCPLISELWRSCSRSDASSPNPETVQFMSYVSEPFIYLFIIWEQVDIR